MIIYGILSLVCMIYFVGLVIYCGFTSKFYLFWLFLGIVFLFLAINAKTHWLRRLPGWCKKTFWIFFAIGMCVFLVTELLIFSGCFSKGRDNLDYVVVLGAGVRPGGTPSKALKRRLDKALEYYEDNKNTVFVVSGGQGHDEPMSEAECMHDYLVKNGIPKEQIVLEDQSVDTNQNLRYSKKLIPEGSSVGIISNNFHIFRAVHIAKKTGIEDPYGIAAGGDVPTAPHNFIREFFGVMKDLLCGNLG